MKIWAQYQAVIEILDAVLTSSKPADRIAQAYFKSRRYMGSSDRRAIKDLLFTVIRQQLVLTQYLKNADDIMPITGRSLFICYGTLSCNEDFTHNFTNLHHGPAVLNDDENNLIRQIRELSSIKHKINNLAQGFEHVNSLYPANFFEKLNQPAPCDLRVNTSRTDRETILQQLQNVGIAVEPTPFSPVGIRVEQAIDLKKLKMYQQGFIEIQDEGSQLVTYLCPLSSCETFLDICAGSGGKSLHLSTLTAKSITVTDIDPVRLQRCQQRLQRAQVKHTNCLPYDQALKQSYDCIIIDAPCTGSGTWRRQPDLQNKLSKDLVVAMVQKQYSLLNQSLKCINRGGYIVYITCSFLPEENEQQIENFLKDHGDYSLVESIYWPNFIQPFAENNYLKLSPLKSQTDAFFAALLRKKDESKL